MNKSVVEELDSNPFARIRAVRYYDSFTVFDTTAASSIGQSGMVTPPIFGGGYMNPLLIERVINGGPPMDYRKFLTFAIAWDNRKTEPGVKFFWPLFDLKHKGYLTIEDFTDFIESMVSILQTMPAVCGPQGPNAVEVLKHEIIDVLRSHITWDSAVSEQPPNCIFSFQQAIKNPNAFGTVIGLIGNTQTFMEYECREETAHKNFLTKQLKEAKISQAKTHQSSSDRANQLSLLQSIIDDAWLLQPPPVASKFDSFAEFLDYHETVYGGESMEPWLTRYYQWEEAEAAAALNADSTSIADVSTSEIQTRE
jgi:hypothetical protein